MVQFGFGAGGDTIARIDPVIEHRGFALLIHKAVAAEYGFVGVARGGKQSGGVKPPVQKIDARGMTPAIVALVLEDVAEMVLAVPEDGAVGIEGHTPPFRIYKVIGRPVQVAQHEFADFPLCPTRLPTCSLSGSSDVGDCACTIRQPLSTATMPTIAIITGLFIAHLLSQIGR